jgi:metallo-beta-lactamase class B
VAPPHERRACWSCCSDWPALTFLFRIWKTNGDRGGQQPAEPFRIAGNFYYVGANDVALFLITGPEGHVLLDGGYPGTPPMIMASIAKLGFGIKDVKGS